MCLRKWNSATDSVLSSRTCPWNISLHYISFNWRFYPKRLPISAFNLEGSNPERLLFLWWKTVRQQQRAASSPVAVLLKTREVQGSTATWELEIICLLCTGVIMSENCCEHGLCLSCVQLSLSGLDEENGWSLNISKNNYHVNAPPPLNTSEVWWKLLVKSLVHFLHSSCDQLSCPKNNICSHIKPTLSCVRVVCYSIL